MIPTRKPDCITREYWLDDDEQYEIMDRLSAFPHLVTQITVEEFPDGEQSVHYKGKRIYKNGKIGNVETVMP